MDWQALGAGFAFYLIFEGLMPLLNPRGFKQTLAVVMSSDEKSLRTFGAALIFFGVFLLYAIR